MLSDLEATLNQLDEATDGWRSLTRGLSHEQANWRPAPDRWSVAQCMEHLNVTTGKLLPRLTAAAERARARRLESPGPFSYGPMSRWFLRALAPEGGKRLSAPTLYRPSESALDLDAVSDRFQQVSTAFRQAVVAADGLDLARVRCGSPVFPLVRFPLGIWFLSTSSHTLRHLNQAKRVRADARFPTAAAHETRSAR
jgi:hypothetical protein